MPQLEFENNIIKYYLKINTNTKILIILDTKILIILNIHKKGGKTKKEPLQYSVAFTVEWQILKHARISILWNDLVSYLYKTPTDSENYTAKHCVIYAKLRIFCDPHFLG